MDAAAALERLTASGSPRLEVLEAGSRPEVECVGLVPGSFDPVTVAHLALAEALRSAGCGRVVFVYSVKTMPKEAAEDLLPPLLAPIERIQALLTISSHREDLAVGLASHGRYFEQAAAAQGAFPGAELLFGVGSDKLLQIFDPSWYEEAEAALETLFSCASVGYALRAGDRDAVERILGRYQRWAGRLVELDLPSGLAGVSSRHIRAAIASGRVPEELLPKEALPVVRRALSGRGLAF